jgi:hypothetical protein
MPFSAPLVKRLLLVVTASSFLAACGPSSQELADQSAVERSGVSPAIYDKMVHDDNLSLSDVVALSHARVNPGIIIRYIRDHGTVYYLSSADFDYLRKNGVDQSVIDFMAQTGRVYGPYDAYPYGPGPYPGPYYGPGPVVPIGIGIGIGGGGDHHWH